MTTTGPTSSSRTAIPWSNAAISRAAAGDLGGGQRAGRCRKLLAQVSEGGLAKRATHGVQDDLAFRSHVIRQPVVHPDAFAAVVDEARVREIAQMPRRLRLGDLQDLLEVAHAELRLLQEQSEHFETGLIGQRLEDPSERAWCKSLVHGIL